MQPCSRFIMFYLFIICINIMDICKQINLAFLGSVAKHRIRVRIPFGGNEDFVLSNKTLNTTLLLGKRTERQTFRHEKAHNIMVVYGTICLYLNLYWTNGANPCRFREHIKCLRYINTRI